MSNRSSPPSAASPKESQNPPPIVSDFFDIFSSLTNEQQALRERVRTFAESFRPALADAWERAVLPAGLIEGLRDTDFVIQMHPDTDSGIGAAPIVEGIITMELARVDPSLATLIGVQSGLAMGSIKLCGSPEQIAEWIPGMRRWEVIGSFGLTEPDVGSGVAGGLTTTCKKSGDAWILNGQKKWIGNAPFADITIIWARDVDDSQVKGFIVDTDTPGVSVRKMEGKIAQRINQNGEITLTEVRVAEHRRLQNANSFADTSRVLSATRAGVSWIAVGCATGAYEVALEYATSRMQFGKPIGDFQLVQRMLVTMLGHLSSMQAMALRVSQMQEMGIVRDDHTSLAKQYCAARCRDVVALGRELFGGNGILLEHDIARYFADAEAIYSYEGTNEINTLIVGRAITGLSAFV